ncbi:MAG: PAS domain S-box protein [Tepidisphaeraceae bacterium]|jgi:PAS domain S-box-containing protein
MNKTRPTYRELEERLAAAEPIIDALRRHEVDAVVGEEKIAFLLLRGVEEALLNSEAGFRAMFDLPGIGMIQADTPAFRFTRVNQKFCEITGYSAEELLTRTLLSLTHPQDRQSAMQRLAQALRGGIDSWTAEKRCVRKDESIIWVRVHGTVLRDDAGRAVRILAMVSDLTESGRAGVPAHRSPMPGKGGRVRPPYEAPPKKREASR